MNIALTVGILSTFAIAIGLITVLAGRVAGLQLRLEQCEVQMANVERSERLTPSRIAELADLKEAVSRTEDLLLKVNRREIARAKRRDDDGTFTNGTDKDALRRRAGLRAGQPAPHQ